MSDEKGQDRAARIGLSRPTGGGRLELKKTVETGMVRQSFSHGRSKAVAVEVKKTRSPVPPARPPFAAPSQPPPAVAEARSVAAPPRPAPLHPVAPVAEARAPEPRPAPAVEARAEPHPAPVPVPAPEPVVAAAPVFEAPTEPAVPAPPSPVAAAPAAATPRPTVTYRPGPNMTAPPPRLWGVRL
jgi:translation initiation factor IF-2